MQSFICDVKAWATANMLKFNDNKTELMLVTTKRTKHLHSLPTSITIGNAQIPFKESVKNLGLPFDCHLTMNAHVSNIDRTCYFELRRLTSIRRFLTSTATATLVLSQVSSYLNSHSLCNTCQSAYRPGHSTETALLKVVNDMFLSLNKGNISVLALLDFSSAFDTIDHPILVHRLNTDFGFTDNVLQWFSSYLTDRTHYVSLSNHCSALTHVHSGVPQGSVLGPIRFTMFIKPLSAIIDSLYHTSFIC